MFLAGLEVFEAASAGSAFASSPDRLVLSRAFMGLGAAGAGHRNLVGNDRIESHGNVPDCGVEADEKDRHA